MPLRVCYFLVEDPGDSKPGSFFCDGFDVDFFWVVDLRVFLRLFCVDFGFDFLWLGLSSADFTGRGTSHGTENPTMRSPAFKSTTDPPC